MEVKADLAIIDVIFSLSGISSKGLKLTLEENRLDSRKAKIYCDCP